MAKDRISSRNLQHKIHFLDRVENVDEYLRAADIFVLPTKREGFSGAVLEAMATGLPIVTSDIPEISHSQITNGVEGILVPVGDVEKLTETIISLLGNRQQCARLGQAARMRVESEFTYDMIGSKYLKLYRHLLRRK